LSKKRKRQRELLEAREADEARGATVAAEQAAERPFKPKAAVKYGLLLDPAKIAWLLRASETPMPLKVEPKINLDYPTYTQQQQQEMVAEYLGRLPVKPKF
jgi:hypothetical protein